MNEIIQSLKSRRSTKAFTDKRVSDELLNEILEAGLYAPSGMNNQQVVTVAVRDKKTRDQLSRMNREILGTDTDPFYGAPCVIVVLSDPQRRTWVEDGSLVMGNLMTAAHSVGLGCCWIHRAKEMFDSPEGKSLLKQWGLPENLRGIGNCILGQPAQEPAEKPRREGRIVKV